MARTETEIRRLIRSYVRALEPTIQVDRVILYGSYAHGKPHEWSDIDLAVISSDFANKNRWDRQGILGRAKVGRADLQGATLLPLGSSPREYAHAHHLSLLGEIKRTGKTIYRRRKHSAKTKSRQPDRA